MKATHLTVSMIAAALLVAGCSRGKGDEQAETNAASQSEVNVPIPVEPAVPAITDAPNTAAEPEAPPEDKLSEEAQMMEDAEATGMTSRMDNEQTAPAE